MRFNINKSELLNSVTIVAQGTAEGAPFIANHIIQVTEKAFDDFAGGGTDKKLLKSLMGI